MVARRVFVGMAFLIDTESSPGLEEHCAADVVIRLPVGLRGRL